MQQLTEVGRGGLGPELVEYLLDDRGIPLAEVQAAIDNLVAQVRAAVTAPPDP